MKKILILLFFLSLAVSYSQQEQASNWYFGENAGIKFNSSGAVTSLNNGQLNTREGCASISDNSGDLLFYTDGTTVYNRNHVVMANGNGLLGHDSSTQSAIVVPHPSNSNIFFVFTVGSNQTNSGLKYSIVDMSLDSGFGQVTVKNVNLLNGCSEKVSAVLQDCDSNDIWVIALSDINGNSSNTFDTFHAFEVTNAGVNINSVTSTFDNITISDSRGYLKLSPDGTKLACANVQSGLYLFDFDTTTGIVSNDTRLNIFGNNDKPYGVEFSQSSELLYVTSSNDLFGQGDDDPSSHFSRLTQFDLTIPNIQDSEYMLDERNLYRGGLQLAPDGKIYRALSATYDIGIPYLSVIDNPNGRLNESNYIHEAISLNGNNSTQGLPPFIASFFNEKIDIINNGSTSTYLPLCEGDTYTLMYEDIPGATYVWTQNGHPLPNETDFDLVVTEPGLYEVFIELSTGECNSLEGEAIVEYFGIPVVEDSTLVQCDDDTDGISVFNLNEAFDDLIGSSSGDLTIRFYRTIGDAEIGGFNFVNPDGFTNTTNPQTLYAQVVESNSNCSSIGELLLRVNVTTTNNIIADSVCDEAGSEDGINTFNLAMFDSQVLDGLPIGLDVTYYETFNNALTEQFPLSTDYSNSNPYSQTIYVRIENNNECFGISQILLTIDTLPQLDEDESLLYCLNFNPETITLDAGVLDSNPINYTYSWSSGQATPQIEVNEIGIYTVTVTNTNGCSNDRTITVLPSNIATIDSIEVLDGNTNNTVIVNASGEGIYEYALFDSDGIYANYQDSNIFDNVYPGIYTVSVRDTKNNCGITEQLISVIGFPLFFTPNNDGYNDTWQVIGISEQFQANSKILIFDRFGKLIKQLDPLSPGWNGTFNGNALPNNDYWFSATLQDGRIFTGHFTLKR